MVGCFRLFTVIYCFFFLFSSSELARSEPAPTRKVTVVDGKSPAEYVATQIGKSWAVVIGIDNYLDPKIPRLKYAVADARAIAKELERRGYQVTMLLNEQATERAINTELRAKLRQRTSKDDRVVIYYAGHGQDDRVEGSRTMGYILPVDGELDNIPGTGISMGVIKELADALPAKHALFLMDACFAGVAGQATRGLPKMNEAYLKQITRERSRQLITAGGADQEAMEASDGGHGLFTAYLLKGLHDGLADLNGDGIIPTSELYAYLDQRVFDDAQMRGHQQRPEIWSLSAEKGEFVFFTTVEGGSNSLNRQRDRLPASGLSSGEVLQPPSQPQETAMLHSPVMPSSPEVCSPPVSRTLARIQPPAGWKGKYDPSKKMTNCAPQNIPQNRDVAVFIGDPMPIINPEVAGSDRYHEVSVVSFVSNLVNNRNRIEKALTRQMGKVPWSTGVIIDPDGNRVWVTLFTLATATEGQMILFFAEGEDLHQTYLPTVRAMFDERMHR